MARNVVVLSHLDPELHDWLKEEAKRRSEAAGHRVGWYLVFNEAVRAYRDNMVNAPVPAVQS